jgi:hypothetical protein
MSVVILRELRGVNRDVGRLQYKYYSYQNVHYEVYVLILKNLRAGSVQRASSPGGACRWAGTNRRIGGPQSLQRG